MHDTINQNHQQGGGKKLRSLSLLLIGASAVVTLLIANIALTLHNTRKLHEEADWVQHTDQVIHSLEKVNTFVKEGESGVRGYVITGQRAYLEAHQAAITGINKQANAVARLTADNPRQQARIPALRQRIAAKIDVMNRTISARREKGMDAAAQIVLSEQPKKTTDALRALVAEMTQKEQDLLVERKQQHDRTYRTALLTGGLSGIASLAAISAFIVLLRQYLTVRDQYTATISEQTQRLRTTLASIGDAVITTDIKGCITSLNAVAESLTGYQNSEAIGQPLSSVFKIVNETTRQPVENPAVRALSEGAIVGLANHTVLIAKNGTERPIDDSAAPIRQIEGEVLGCVLVFRDVTQRRQAEEQLQHSEDRFRSLVDATTSIVWTTNEAGEFVTPQPSWSQYTGQTWDELKGFGWANALHPEDQERIRLRWEEASRQRSFYQSDGRLWHAPSQSYRYFEVKGVPIYNTDGSLREWVGMCVDVEDRKHLEADQRKLLWLADNTTDFISMCDLEGVPFYANLSALRKVGLDSMEEVDQMNIITDLFFPEDQDRIANKFFPSVLEKGNGQIEVRFRHQRTGEAIWMLYSVTTLRNTEGRPTGFATISQDITERRQMENNLRQLAADLSEADRRKDEFLATLAHELRNPLAPIRNGLQVIKIADPNSETVKQVQVMMERQLTHMVRLVDDLLDMSRISRGKIELRLESVELSSVIEQAIETSRPLIDAAQHELTVTQPPQPIYLNADSVRIAQVLSNLLTNASKYSEPDGQIWVTVESQGSEVLVSVKDTGIGISPEMLPHIFDLFKQVEGALVRSQEGLGIGLTLVKQLVEMHDGSVTAFSQGLGQGSEFVVRLPILSAIPQTSLFQNIDNELTSVETPRRILIVDDSEDAAWSLELLFQSYGDETYKAFDGMAALAAAASFRPDIILLDIGLPKLNGYEVARRIREQPWGKDVVLIALTGWGQDEDRRKSSEAGFDGHLVKPIDYEALTQLLAELWPH